MRFQERILYFLSKKWKSPVANRSQELGGDPSQDSYHINYAMKNQFQQKVLNGTGIGILNKTILEIGCGHGGISLFMALNGAKHVVGIDLNTKNLGHAKSFKRIIEDKYSMQKGIPVEFLEMNAYDLHLASGKFDLVFADNVFEHFMEPRKVLEQSYKVLKPGGILVVPTFSSIWSKYALHLKNGLKVPWANLFFSEKTICNVMIELSKHNNNIAITYPGVENNPKKVRDLRKYGDLNNITYVKFKDMALDVGFDIKKFRVNPTPRIVGGIANRIPIIKNSMITEILSSNASALLVKK